MESPLGNEYLNSGLMPQLPALSDIPSPLDGSSSPSSRPDSMPTFNSQPDISKPFSLGAAPTSLKRNSTVTGTYRQSSLLVPAAKKRLSTIGISSPLGRLYKMFGDFCLLAGRTEDSAKWYAQGPSYRIGFPPHDLSFNYRYVEAISVFKVSQDPIWQASALEALATISVLDAWSAGQGLVSRFTCSIEPFHQSYPSPPLTEQLRRKFQRALVANR